MAFTIYNFYKILFISHSLKYFVLNMKFYENKSDYISNNNIYIKQNIDD